MVLYGVRSRILLVFVSLLQVIRKFQTTKQLLYSNTVDHQINENAIAGFW